MSILIYARNQALFLPLKRVLEEGGAVVRSGNSFHETAVLAVLTEPDLIALELGPEDFSALTLRSLLDGVKSPRKPFRYFFFSPMEAHHGFLHLYDQVHFLDRRNPLPVFEKIQTLLSIPAASWQKRPPVLIPAALNPAAGDPSFSSFLRPGAAEHRRAGGVFLPEKGIRSAFGAAEEAGKPDLQILKKLDQMGIIRKK